MRDDVCASSGGIDRRHAHDRIWPTDTNGTDGTNGMDGDNRLIQVIQ